MIRTGAGIFYGEPNSPSTEGAHFASGLPKQVEITIQQNFETTDGFVRNGFPALRISNELPRGSQINVFPDFRENRG